MDHQIQKIIVSTITTSKFEMNFGEIDNKFWEPHKNHKKKLNTTKYNRKWIRNLFSISLKFIF
jgi:hypothetical protein